MRFRLSIVLIGLLTGCTLSRIPPGEGAQGQFTAEPSPGTGLVAECNPTKPGIPWYLYTAQTGETVEEVIVRTGTTREIVIEGNCWSTIPAVQAGNQWYMPPASIDPLPDLTNVPVGGTLKVDPFTYGDGGTLSLLQKQVTLSMKDYPASTRSVFFYVRVDGEVIGIGTDADLSDGASIAWEALPNLTYDRAALAAVAYDANSLPILHTLEFGVNTV
jgi:hypothetical protein